MTIPPHCIEIGGHLVHMDRIVAIGPVQFTKFSTGWQHSFFVALEHGHEVRWLGGPIVEQPNGEPNHVKEGRTYADACRNELIQRVWGGPPPPYPDLADGELQAGELPTTPPNKS